MQTNNNKIFLHFIPQILFGNVLFQGLWYLLNVILNFFLEYVSDN